MSRKKLIAANWKMYKNPAQTEEFFRAFLPLIFEHHREEIVVCPPYIDLQAALESAKGPQIAIGAQDVYWKDEGAFTGEISSPMLVAIGCTHVIIGHSERWQYFAETDDTVNLKLKAALGRDLTPIVCVGEVLEEREAELTEDVLRRQCLRAFNAISAKKAAKLVIAYEPVWAIGTGKTATPQMASDAHVLIRGEAAKAFGQEFADGLRILYGGACRTGKSTPPISRKSNHGCRVGGRRARA